MKKFIIALLFICTAVAGYAQKKHIPQSTPFENVLKALTKNKPLLFKNSFSQRVIDGEEDLTVWAERIEEGNEKFGRRFPDFKRKDFRYGFDSAESKLIVFYKGEEAFRMKVIQEGKKWKLNEK